MKPSRACSLLSLAAAAAMARPCRANGFLIYDMSGEAVGRASAVSASISEPAAVWFNPAALTSLSGVRVAAGGIFITARSHFEERASGAQTSSERGNFFLPTLYGSARLTDDVSVGMGVYSAFGIGIEWPDDWLGRESTIAASLKTLAFNPTVALRLHPRLSLGAGFDAVRSTVEFRNGLPALIGGDVTLAGGTWGFGFNAGLLYRAVPDWLDLAVTYRSRVKLAFDGDADFEPDNRDFAPSLPDQPGSATVTLPDILTAGLMFRAHRKLELGLDANYVLWTTYSSVDIDFESAPDRTLRPDGQDSFMLRAGFDWSLPRADLHLRGGLIFDQGAIPEQGLGPGLPDADRIDVTTGLGYVGPAVKADLGYMLVCFLPSDARGGREGPEGTYRTLAHLFGVTLGATWE